MKPSDRAVLELLRDRGDLGVTALEALTEAGTFRLAARVLELRALGHRIETRMVPTMRGAHIARYFLIEEAAA